MNLLVCLAVSATAWAQQPQHSPDAIQPEGVTIMDIVRQGTGVRLAPALQTPSFADSIDASADSLKFNPPYTQMPFYEATPFTWTVKASNKGSNTLNGLSTMFTLNDGSSDIFAPAASNNAGVASGAMVSNGFGPYLPGKGIYTAKALVSTGAQTDQNPANDTVQYTMSIGDSVMARDNGIRTGALSIGAGSGGGTIGQVFELSGPAYLSSVTFYCYRPIADDTTSVDIYEFLGYPAVLIASTPQYYFTPSDAINGVWVTLPVTGGPMLVSAGTYFVGVREYSSNLSLGTTTFNFQPEAGWLTFGLVAWKPSEDYNQHITYMVRLNLINPNVYAGDIQEIKPLIYPNPSSSQLTVKASESMAGKPYSVELIDLSGRVITELTTTTQTAEIAVSALSEGLYFARVSCEGKSVVTKVSVAR